MRYKSQKEEKKVAGQTLQKMPRFVLQCIIRLDAITIPKNTPSVSLKVDIEKRYINVTVITAS